ncbi:MAG: polymer-forming cytoskeletal protein [Pyrinomonadaceae bacterium]
MEHSLSIKYPFPFERLTKREFLIALLFLLIPPLSLLANPNVSLSADEQTMTVENAPETEIISIGKTVIVKQSAKGVFAFGGDIIIEGRVEGDVGTIGGSVIQKKDAFIGGDVIVFGGSYKPEIDQPLRNVGKETIMIGVFEEELRSLSQNPSELFTPSFSLVFFAQRALSVLFWFVVSLGFATIAPGAVSRSIARVNISALKVIGIGFFAFLVVTIGVVGSFSFLPNYLSGILGLMSIVLLMLAFVFGRVVLNVSFGKLLQKHFLPDNNQSETLAIFIGVVVWTVILSIPYLWPFALLALFSAGIGLVLTARSPIGWKTN